MPLLVEQAAAGHPNSRRLLFARLAPTIRARVHAELARKQSRFLEHEKDDLVQEVWIDLLHDRLQKLRAWDPARGCSLESFVALLTRRRLSMLARKRWLAVRWQCPDVDADAHPARNECSPEIVVAAWSSAARIRQALEGQRSGHALAVFERIFEQNWSVEETAEHLGVTCQVVYNCNHKIRRLALDDAELSRPVIAEKKSRARAYIETADEAQRSR